MWDATVQALQGIKYMIICWMTIINRRSQLISARNLISTHCLNQLPIQATSILILLFLRMTKSISILIFLKLSILTSIFSRLSILIFSRMTLLISMFEKSVDISTLNISYLYNIPILHTINTLRGVWSISLKIVLPARSLVKVQWSTICVE